MPRTIVVRRRCPRSGDEVASLRLADETTALSVAFAEADQIAGCEWVSNPTGSDSGMLLVRDDQQVLGGIMMSPEFLAI